MINGTAEIFGGEHTLDEVATSWLTRFGQHESKSVSEIVNLVLRCAGCDQSVDEHDIEDPDHCSSRLRDIQDEYQEVRTCLLPGCFCSLNSRVAAKHCGLPTHNTRQRHCSLPASHH